MSSPRRLQLLVRLSFLVAVLAGPCLARAEVLPPASAADTQEMDQWLWGDSTALQQAFARRFPRGAGNLLCLSDGRPYTGRAHEIALALPALHVHRTNLELGSPPADALPNLSQSVLDNTRPFVGLNPRGYELVIMRRGLCPCAHTTLDTEDNGSPAAVPTSCAGIAYQHASMVSFLQEVLGTLRTDRPGAAMLHGRLFEVDGPRGASWDQARVRWEAATAEVVRGSPGVAACLGVFSRKGYAGLILTRGTRPR